MANEPSRTSSAPLAIGFAALAVVGVVVILFSGGGEDSDRSDRPVSEAASEAASTAAAPSPAADAADPRAATEGGLSSAGPGSLEQNAGVAPLAIEPMPARVAADFERATAPISEESRALMEKGMEEMPPEIREAFENAPNAPIPQHVLRDFENPYPELPEEKRKLLWRNGEGLKQP